MDIGNMSFIHGCQAFFKSLFPVSTTTSPYRQPCQDSMVSVLVKLTGGENALGMNS